VWQAAVALLSFIVVARTGHQAHLETCARSILGQAFADVEVVAVDDAATDHGPAVLDALAERDARVRVLHLSEPSGLGGARNAGVDAASGEYVWVVRPTDRVAPGALAGIAARLETERPDVMVVEHDRADALGRRRGVKARAVHEPPVFARIYRRGLLDGLRFGPTQHGERCVTWPAGLAAQRVSHWPATAYLRTDPANAPSDGGGPDDLLRSYDELLRLLPDRGELVAEALARDGLAALDRLGGARRNAFLGELSERLAGGPEPASRRALLVAQGRYGALRAFDEMQRLKAAARRRRAAVQRRARKATVTARHRRVARHYRARRRQPLDPDLAVFAAYWYRGYACNPRAIYEKARELVPSLHGVWVVKEGGQDGMPEGVPYVVAGTPEYFDVIARASYLVNNVNFPDHLVKREGSVHVMTHHGTPLKRMGLDLRDNPGAQDRTNFEGLLRRCRRWDFSVSQNPFTTLVWERAYPTRYESLETGYPRNDVLATATAADGERVRASLGVPDGVRTVLYAPTHREYLPKDAGSPMDVAAVAAGLGEDHVLLVRTHYFYDADPALRELHRAGRVVDVSGHPSIEELCLASDVLVTDYSSLMFDYAVLDRPILVHAPDWEVYRAVRGTTFDLLAEPPGAVARTEAEVVDALLGGAADGEEARQDREAFRARFCALDDGRAAERVVRRVWFGEPVAAPSPEAVVSR
jgi:CDP-glycerol glycerophosphotransferase